MKNEINEDAKIPTQPTQPTAAPVTKGQGYYVIGILFLIGSNTAPADCPVESFLLAISSLVAFLAGMIE